tara:strand:- start:90 stop:221 length:132 start_codon:yes stop_codon:yes gene_type:complete
MIFGPTKTIVKYNKDAINGASNDNPSIHFNADIFVPLLFKLAL